MEAILYHPSRDRPFYLMTDASKTSLGAFLYQKDDNEQRRIVSMASRSLRGAEVNYFTTELELLAIAWALGKFRSYILGGPIKIETDHQALTYLLSCRFLNSRLIRWRLAIQDYCLEITHIPGTKNQIADALSRIPLNNRDEQTEEASIALILTRKPNVELRNRLKNVALEQRGDKKLENIIAHLEKGAEYSDFHLKRNVLIKGKKERERVVVAESLAKMIIHEIHELYGHIGSYKCRKIFEEAFWMTKARRYIAQWIRVCDSCQRNKTYTHPNEIITAPIIPAGPNDLLSIDYLGPLPVSKAGTRYILVTIDAFTKFVKLYPMRKIDTRTTINKIFNDYIPKYGKPRRIQSDHGSQFTSRAWEKQLSGEGIIHTFSSIRHPQSNIVERVNKEIGRFFRTITGHKHGGWAHWVPFVENCLNEIYHETTEFTPIELHLGTAPTRFWEKWLMPLMKQEIPLGTKLMMARERIKRKREAHATKENDNARGTRYKVGDRVLVKACNLSNATDNLIAKFLTLYEGPYIVKEQVGPSTFLLTNPNTGEGRGVFHATNFRPYLQNADEEADEEGT